MLREGEVAQLLEDDAFNAAFDSYKPEGEDTPEVKADVEPETVPETTPEPETVTEPAAAVPEVKVETATPAPATASEIAAVLAEAVKAATAKPETPVETVAVAEEEDTPEVIAALADLEQNWNTHSVAVTALLAKQRKELKAEFAEILKPLQAQIEPMVAAGAENAQDKFNAALLAEHADAFTILPDVEAWIATQPAYLQPAYNQVLDNGSAQDVSKFLTDYKTATGKNAPDTAAQEAAAKVEAAKVEAAKKLKKMEAPTTTRTSVTAEADPSDFDSAFEAGTKIALSM